MTRYAKMILDIINNSSDHLTAEQIYLILKNKNEKVVLATVYNTLAALYKEGLIRKVLTEGCSDRYDRVKRHDHLVCKNCGKIMDITLDDLTATLQKQLGFNIDSYDLRVNYFCEDCRKMMEE